MKFKIIFRPDYNYGKYRVQYRVRFIYGWVDLKSFKTLEEAENCIKNTRKENSIYKNTCNTIGVLHD